MKPARGVSRSSGWRIEQSATALSSASHCTYTDATPRRGSHGRCDGSGASTTTSATSSATIITANSVGRLQNSGSQRRGVASLMPSPPDPNP